MIDLNSVVGRLNSAVKGDSSCLWHKVMCFSIQVRKCVGTYIPVYRVSYIRTLEYSRATILEPCILHSTIHWPMSCRNVLWEAKTCEWVYSGNKMWGCGLITLVRIGTSVKQLWTRLWIFRFNIILRISCIYEQFFFQLLQGACRM
jgi:hypothetical protein